MKVNSSMWKLILAASLGVVAGFVGGGLWFSPATPSSYTMVYDFTCVSDDEDTIRIVKYSTTSPYQVLYCAPPECCGKNWTPVTPLPPCLQGKTGSYDRKLVDGSIKYYKHDTGTVVGCP